MKVTLLTLFIGTVVFTSSSQNPAPAAVSPLDINGNIQIQAQKTLRDDNNPNNLDNFFGRANFGATYKSADYVSCLNIRAFPEGWGFEALTLNVKDSMVTSQKTTPIARFIIEQAWVKYIYNIAELRIGHYFLTTSNTLHFGNYLDQNSAPGFQNRLSYHNAIDLTVKSGPLSSNVLLGAADKYLNTGYLRIYETLTLTNDALLKMGLGYRSNVFDRIYDNDARIENRFSFKADYKIIDNLIPYVEIGMLQNYTNDEYDIPIAIGTEIPTRKFFNSLIAELEIVQDRTVTTANKVIEDVPLHWNIYVDKKVGTRSRFQVGIFSDPLGTASDLQFALRYTGSIK
jgi:hypothetical protein